MTTGTTDALSEAQGRVDVLWRQAVRQRLWLTALFILLFRRKIVSVALQSRQSAQPPRSKSPFIYDMR